MLDFIQVMQMARGNREKGYCLYTAFKAENTNLSWLYKAF